jgi:hypothetical protein
MLEPVYLVCVRENPVGNWDIEPPVIWIIGVNPTTGVGSLNVTPADIVRPGVGGEKETLMLLRTGVAGCRDFL